MFNSQSQIEKNVMLAKRKCKKIKNESVLILWGGIVDNLLGMQKRLQKHTFHKTGRHKIEFTVQGC